MTTYRPDEEAYYTELKVLIVHQTDKAVLVDIDGDGTWIPWSQIEDNGEDFRDGYEGTMYVTEWFCLKEGLS